MHTQRKPTHPGEVLREDVIIPLHLSITEAAKRMGVNPRNLSALLKCKSSLTPEMAIRIARATKTTPESWLYMQAKYDLWQAEQNFSDVESFGELVAV
ncbi:MAG: HigA family addiction module antitoxin [candidate division KSB1 bacterium]|nr:HigA family addiction module antitoxin [candidate division KSB1 bacterium]